MSTVSKEEDYLWQHFQFNADQQLKAFNFFVDGGVFTAFEKPARSRR